MTMQVGIKNLSVQIVDTTASHEDILLSSAVEKAKAIYGENIMLALISPSNINEELAFRPDMAQFMSDTSKQEMKISILSALKDTFNTHHAMAVDGSPRSHREPSARTMYFITDGRVLAIDPTQESLDKFL